MTKPKLLDLFCGGGGAAMGYNRAGFDVYGVDVVDQPRYPFHFHQGDALSIPFDGFDAVHASPPCQTYSSSAAQYRKAGKEYADLVDATRARLMGQTRPWVIENVPGAPIRPDIILCGCLFDLPHLVRQRWFECGNWTPAPWRAPCWHPLPALSVAGHSGGAERPQREAFKAARGRYPTVEDGYVAMGINWLSQSELSQAIPPAYTEWIGEQLMGVLCQANR